MSRAPRLQFTKEEAESPELKRPIQKQQKAAAKADAAAARLPQKKVRRLAVDKETGKVTAKLQFDVKKPPSKLKHAAAEATVDVASVHLHHEMAEDADENVGVEAAHGGEIGAESYVHALNRSIRSEKVKPYRRSAAAERRLDKANLDVLTKKAQQENPTSNLFSKLAQKRQIRREYAASKGGKTAKTVKNTAEAARRAAEKVEKAAEKTTEFVVKHRKGILIVLAFGLMLAFLLNFLSSCGVLGGGAGSVVTSTTYQSEDEDTLGAEAAYCAMEDELRARLDNYEAEHDFDEYHFDLDEIGHDPYVLISILSALHEGPWTLEEMMPTLEDLFAQQYILTETVIEETHTHTEVDEDGEEYEVSEPYYICTVTLENFNLSHLPVYLMDEEQLGLYAAYMATLGNRPDLFPESDYVNLYDGNYTTYDIPTEALEDERFAAMMAEATKYLGYPYVWGGSSPATSFDCSGFVSWVLNHSGWNVGRLSAQGLCNLCTPTSTPHPGDLVFFKGTYDTTEVSHVGIYVGNNMMLHCGDPISYADLSSNYWQQHFYCYGRLPDP